MIRFTCPSCGLAVSAPDDCVGRSTKCRGCNNPIVVPLIAAPVAKIVPSATPCRSWSKSRITAKVLGSIFLVFLGFLLGHTMHLPKPTVSDPPSLASVIANGKEKTGKLWERQALKARLNYASPEEVRQLLGEPEGSGHRYLLKDPTFQQLRSQALRLGMRPEEDPGSEYWNSDDRLTDHWYYRRVTRNPETQQADPSLVICFRWGQVDLAFILNEEGKLSVVLLGRLPSP
ncbi:MAG: hypothetical protein ACYC3I_08165 [Gemmataceae bacterium]